MEGRIKSALEKAMERAAAFPEVSAEEMTRIENLPRGRSIGASFINNKDFDLKNALAVFAPEIKKHIAEGIEEVLLMNITLNAEEEALQSSRRAMEGILLLKQDKSRASALLGELDQLLQYYRQAFEQTRERFKQEYEARARAARRQGIRDRAMERMDFREEWSGIVRQMNARFESGLAEIKDKIKAVS